MQQVVASNSSEIPAYVGRWVTEAVYSDIHSVPGQTLCNWRYRDKKAKRSEALPGYPKYRKFGRAIRYWIDGVDARTLDAAIDKAKKKRSQADRGDRSAA